MKILTLGDSFTYGEGSSDPETMSWPAQMARRYGVTVVNLGDPGSSNRRAVRKGIDELCKNRYDYVIWPLGPASRQEILSAGKWLQFWPANPTSDGDRFFLEHWHSWNDIVSAIYSSFEFYSVCKSLDTPVHISNLSFANRDYMIYLDGIRRYQGDLNYQKLKIPNRELNAYDVELGESIIALQGILKKLDEAIPDLFDSVIANYLRNDSVRKRYNITIELVGKHPDDAMYSALADYYANRIGLA